MLQVNEPHLLHLESANGGELLADAGDVKGGVTIDFLAGFHVGNSHTLVVEDISLLSHEQGGSWRRGAVMTRHHRVKSLLQANDINTPRIYFIHNS